MWLWLIVLVVLILLVVHVVIVSSIEFAGMLERWKMAFTKVVFAVVGIVGTILVVLLVKQLRLLLVVLVFGIGIGIGILVFWYCVGMRYAKGSYFVTVPAHNTLAHNTH